MGDVGGRRRRARALQDGSNRARFALECIKTSADLFLKIRDLNCMNRRLYHYLAPTFLVLIFATPVPLSAQESPEAALEEVTEIIDNEASEASKNLRESVHENLESIQQDVETSNKLRETQKTLEAAQEEQQATEPPPQPTPDSVAAEPEQTDPESEEQVVEEKSLIDRFQAIPAYLQSIPERVPFIRDRGLIFFGRAELDFAYYSSGITSDDTGFRVRSLRAGLAKAFPHSMSVKAEIDLTDGDSNWADLYVRYRHKRWGLFTVGNQRVAQTLVNQTSRISRTFMEEPLPAEAFGLGRRLALGWDLHKPKVGAHVTLFGSDLNGDIGDEGYAARLYFNPTRSRFNLFHVGASIVSENMSRKTRFFAHPESRVTSQRLVDTGKFDNVYQQQIAVVEVAGARESFMFRGEFFQARWQRKGEGSPQFRGFYVQASWALTGETFNYTQGKFLRIRPQNLRGAWELAARYSKVNLNDLDITGGEERNLTIGVNWYSPGNQFRIMSNLIFVRTDKYAGYESPTIFQLRAQFHW